MAKRPARPVPRERHMGEGGWPPADRTPQGIGQMIDRELAVLELRKFLVHRLNRMRLARSERGHQCGPRDIGFAVNEYVHRRKTLIVHAPAVVQMVIDRNLDDARGRHAGAEYRFQGSGKIDPIETQNDVSLAYRIGRLRSDADRAGRADVQPMVGWKGCGDLKVSSNPRAEPLGERDARVPGIEITRYAAGKNQRMLCLSQQIGGAFDGGRRGDAVHRRHESPGVDRFNWLNELAFLHSGIEVDVSWSSRRGVGDPVCAQHRFARRNRRGRLIVPLGVAAYQGALVSRGMNPVDPWPPYNGIDRSRGAKDDNRHAIAPGVEDRHGRVHKPDVRMHGGRHRPAGHLGIAMGDRHRAFLMQAQQHLRLFVAQIIDQAVVQPAVARAWIERDVRDIGRAQRIRDDIAAEAGSVHAGRNRAIERRQRVVTRRARLRAIVSVAGQYEGSAVVRPAGGWPASNRITGPVSIVDYVEEFRRMSRSCRVYAQFTANNIFSASAISLPSSVRGMRCRRQRKPTKPQGNGTDRAGPSSLLQSAWR